MKSKIIDFDQHLYHEIEDEDEAEKYLDDALPSIGHIVMYFNALESSLDKILCENFTDRTDTIGLIVLNGMNFSSKVELFKRFCDDFHLAVDQSIEGYEQLINNIKESGKLRNLVVHANWESTDEHGYTYIRLKMSKQSMHQEYVQFSVEALQKIINLIITTRWDLYKYWDLRDELLHK